MRFPSRCPNPGTPPLMRCTCVPFAPPAAIEEEAHRAVARVPAGGVTADGCGRGEGQHGHGSRCDARQGRLPQPLPPILPLVHLHITPRPRACTAMRPTLTTPPLTPLSRCPLSFWTPPFPYPNSPPCVGRRVPGLIQQRGVKGAPGHAHVLQRALGLTVPCDSPRLVQPGHHHLRGCGCAAWVALRPTNLYKGPPLYEWYGQMWQQLGHQTSGCLLQHRTPGHHLHRMRRPTAYAAPAIPSDPVRSSELIRALYSRSELMDHSPQACTEVPLYMHGVTPGHLLHHTTQPCPALWAHLGRARLRHHAVQHRPAAGGARVEQGERPACVLRQVLRQVAQRVVQPVPGVAEW